jgi:hypothetical protein
MIVLMRCLGTLKELARLCHAEPLCLSVSTLANGYQFNTALHICMVGFVFVGCCQPESFVSAWRHLQETRT